MGERETSRHMSDPANVPELTWQACPFTRSPLKGMFALSMIGGLAWGTALVSESAALGLVAAIALILVLHRFFFPSTHAIDQQGVTLFTFFGRKTLPWGRINQVRHDATRVYLSTRSGSKSDGGRGLLLLLNGNREAVLSAIDVGRKASSAAESTDADA